ncbi:hypothetical protein ABH11_01517 [Serratia marcescens]|uniref:FAD-dependent oxidoreductase n=1 Tax=Serratia marcescens TaxID=615 RepID=UPI0006CB2C56|nr:FAD-dependent oxidoreductase [Serratia marcescens]ALE95861.1 hypothetical protein ABH11_01517 [Serratia marcescens]
MNKLSELSKPVAWKLHHHDRYYFEENADVVTIAESMGQAKGDAVYSQEYVSALKHESAVNWEAAASLNVENQELKKRIAELERANTSQDDHINQQQDRIDSLEKTNASLGQRLGAAEKRIIELDYLRLSACEVFKEIGNELGCNPDNESIMMAIDELKKREKRVVALAGGNAELLETMAARLEEAETRLATPVRLKKVDSSNVPFAGDGFNAAVDYCAAGVRAAGFSVTVEGDE